MSQRRKSTGPVRIKDVTRGEIEVVFATLGVIDHDGDVLSKSSFDDGAAVVISAYGHGSHRGQLPLGRGRIDMSEDGVAKMVGRFFMDTTHGRDAFLTVKALSEDEGDGAGLQEWSFSLRDVKEHSGELDGVPANFIDSVFVKEVSPVLEGAGINTRTIMAKGVKASASQTERALRSAGAERYGGEDVYVYVEDWDPDESTVVFNVWAPDEAERLVQVGFERDGAGVLLGDEETDVARVTEFVPKALSVPSFADMLKSVVADVASLRKQAEGVLTSRAARGKSGLSAESAALIADLDSELTQLSELAAADATTTLDAPASTTPAALSPTRAAIEIATLEVTT